MQTMKVILGQPTIIILKSKSNIVSSAKPLRRGRISIGMAKLEGWKLSPEGQHSRPFGSTPSLFETLDSVVTRY